MYEYLSELTRTTCQSHNLWREVGTIALWPLAKARWVRVERERKRVGFWLLDGVEMSVMGCFINSCQCQPMHPSLVFEGQSLVYHSRCFLASSISLMVLACFAKWAHWASRWESGMTLVMMPLQSTHLIQHLFNVNATHIRVPHTRRVVVFVSKQMRGALCTQTTPWFSTNNTHCDECEQSDMDENHTNTFWPHSKPRMVWHGAHCCVIPGMGEMAACSGKSESHINKRTQEGKPRRQRSPLWFCLCFKSTLKRTKGYWHNNETNGEKNTRKKDSQSLTHLHISNNWKNEKTRLWEK